MTRRALVGVAAALALGASLLVVAPMDAGAATVAPAAGRPAPIGEAAPGAPPALAAQAVRAAVAPYVPPLADGQPLPTAPDALPAGLDHLAEYQGQNSCTPTAKPGALKLAALLRDTYGPADIWIDRDCADGGQSEHKEGRALDWMRSYNVPAERAKVEAFLWWLLRPGPDGEPAAMARRLGIMYLGWHDRLWASYRADQGWTELKGCFSTPGADYDTYCHRDHLHISLSWDAAAGQTSFWDLTPEALGACPEPEQWAAALGAPLAATVTPVTPWTLVNTRSGAGLAGGPCRLAADRWSGDGRGLELSVTGRGGVPASGVAAVRLAVRATGVNAPTTIVTSATGSSSRTSWLLDGTALGNGVTLQQNVARSTVVVAPVSKAGTVIVRNLTGAADVRVTVTGWVAAATIPDLPATLRVGSTGPAVAAVQTALLRRGYAIPELTSQRVPLGTFGVDTRTAVVRFVTARPALGPATGSVWRSVYRAITGWVPAATQPPSPPATPTVSLAALLRHESAPVKVVQAALNSVVAAGLVVDGQWGPKTQAAYDLFRVTKMGLTGTHEPGPTSLATLGGLAGFTTTA